MATDINTDFDRARRAIAEGRISEERDAMDADENRVPDARKDNTMATDQVDVKISEDLVRGIIETKVQAAITEALSPQKGIVERVVGAALSMKVDDTGKRSSYASDNKLTYLEVLCRKVVQAAAESAIEKWAAERQAVLEAEFLRQLQTKKTSSQLVRACVDGLADAVHSRWRFSVCFPGK